MTSYLGDTLTVGLVLVLLFGSIALYLYTRIQQSEQKISLLESILLDLKMASEVQSYSELPADQPSSHFVNSLKPSSPSSQSSSESSTYPSLDESTEHSHVVTLDPIPESESSESSESSLSDSLQPLEEAEELNEVDQYKSVVAEALNESSSSSSSPKSSVQYEDLTLKELQTLAKTRGLSGSGTMKKAALVEALRSQDRSVVVKPGSLSSSSLLESSVSVSNELV